jgi:hypothetical protein
MRRTLPGSSEKKSAAGFSHSLAAVEVVPSSLGFELRQLGG